MGGQANRHTLSVAEVVKFLQSECIPSPVTFKKITRVYRDDVHAMHQALTFLHQGLLDQYHMIPGNGGLSF